MKRPVALILLLLSFPSLAAATAPLSLRRDASSPPKIEVSRQLLLRLGAFPETARPEEIVDAVSSGAAVPHGLHIGGPTGASFLLPSRLKGRMKDFYDDHPDLPRARLERTVVLEYPSEAAATGILTALSNNPHVDFVEQNRLIHFTGTRAQAPTADLAWSRSSPRHESRGTCESMAGVIPNDPLFAPADPICDKETYQWGSYAMRLPEAWHYVEGHAKVLVVDVGLDVDHPDLRAFGELGLYNDWFIGGNYRSHLSYDYAAEACTLGEHVHGTHTAGIVAATPDNGIGVAGACWHCPFLMSVFTQTATLDQAATALTDNADKGVQLVSMSFGVEFLASLPECEEGRGSPQDGGVMCNALANIESREIFLAASSGNDLEEVELPAIHSTVDAVGAIATDGTHWDRTSEGCGAGGDTFECGSNYSLDPQNQTLDLTAPGQFVLSTAPPGQGYGGTLPWSDKGCGDDYPLDGDPGNDADGYGACTGTSMSSPYVAGVAALLRSANPLLTRGQIRQVLRRTASGGGQWDQFLGYGVPDAAAAVETVQGRTGGSVVQTRATPMFRLYSSTDDTHLFTTSPQAAVSEIEGAGNSGFLSDPSGNPVLGYSAFPGDTAEEPSASFWLFTGPVSPDGLGQALLPLYRLTRDRTIDPAFFCGDGATTTKRAWGYTTSIAEIRTFHTAASFNDNVRYFPEGIEGYLYPISSTPPQGSEKLIRYYDDQRDDWLLLLESETPPAGYDDSIHASGGDPDGTELGWVLPHEDADGDGVVDAWELLLGTNPGVADSDADGCTDGEEILGFVDPSLSELWDPLDGGPCYFHAIFRDGFESGDLSEW